MSKSPTKDELKEIEKSVMRARLRVAMESTRIPALERRLLRKGLNLVPKHLRPLLEEYWSCFAIRKTFFWFKVPFRGVETCCASIERKILRQYGPVERKLVRKYFRQAGPQKVFKDSRPAFEELRYEYITELTLHSLRFSADFEA